MKKTNHLNLGNNLALDTEIVFQSDLLIYNPIVNLENDYSKLGPYKQEFEESKKSKFLPKIYTSNYFLKVFEKNKNVTVLNLIFGLLEQLEPSYEQYYPDEKDLNTSKNVYFECLKEVVDSLSEEAKKELMVILIFNETAINNNLLIDDIVNKNFFELVKDKSVIQKCKDRFLKIYSDNPLVLNNQEHNIFSYLLSNLSFKFDVPDNIKKCNQEILYENKESKKVIINRLNNLNKWFKSEDLSEKINSLEQSFKKDWLYNYFEELNQYKKYDISKNKSFKVTNMGFVFEEMLNIGDYHSAYNEEDCKQVERLMPLILKGMESPFFSIVEEAYHSVIFGAFKKDFNLTSYDFIEALNKDLYHVKNIEGSDKIEVVLNLEKLLKREMFVSEAFLNGIVYKDCEKFDYKPRGDGTSISMNRQSFNPDYIKSHANLFINDIKGSLKNYFHFDEFSTLIENGLGAECAMQYKDNNYDNPFVLNIKVEKKYEDVIIDCINQIQFYRPNIYQEVVETLVNQVIMKEDIVVKAKPKTPKKF